MRSPSSTKNSSFIPASDVTYPGVVNTTCLMCTLYYSEAHTAPECQNDKRDPERGERDVNTGNDRNHFNTIL